MPGRGNVYGLLMGEVARLEARLLIAVTSTSLVAVVAAGVEAQELRAMVIAPPIMSERIPCSAMDGAISAVGENGSVGTS